ncbi:hypothetical protein LCGC14_2835440 [marine sediment metagenome]|uniref:Glucokinase n=1 Tax=marine sediment metagenome TaxID=412755 RepID=A0A0F8YZG6_9ZZZZ
MSLRLVADIGDTNARLALSQAGNLTAGSVKRYANEDWASIDAIKLLIETITTLFL